MTEPQKWPTKLTFKRAQAYLASKGLELSTQQVRNLASKSELIKVEEYTDQITEETHKVLSRASLDAYLKWREANPEVASRGSRSEKRVILAIAPDRLESLNSILTANGFPAASFPERKLRDPNAPKRNYKRRGSGAAAETLAEVQTEMTEPEYEVIEVA